jgi:hypothetical protein
MITPLRWIDITADTETYITNIAESVWIVLIRLTFLLVYWSGVPLGGSEKV